MKWPKNLKQKFQRQPRDREQLIQMIRNARKKELLNSQALGMIEGVLRVSEMQVRDVTVPRSQMVTIDHDAKLEEFLPIMVKSGHSRFPIVGENRDEIIGILLAKDVLKYFYEKHSGFNIEAHMRKAVLIPESKRLDSLLQEFRIKRNHMAVVIDEYGGIAGLITIEDVLEQIVGEIEDEFDVEEIINIKRRNGKTYYAKGLTSITEFNEYFGTDFSTEEFDTIGGYITHQLGHLPSAKESISIGNLTFKILQSDKRRIQLLKVSRSE